MMARRAGLLCLLLALAGVTGGPSPKAPSDGEELADNQIIAYRLMQFDKDGEKYGSRRASVNLMGTVLQDGVVHPGVNRRAVVLHISEVGEDTIDELINAHVGGILIVLPTSLADENPETVVRWRELESQLMQTRVDTALYFTYESPRVERLLASLRRPESGDQFQFVADVGKPQLLKSPSLKNYQGWLPGVPESEGQSVDDLPTVAIVAHYDSLAAVPALAVGADSNGSGVMAILEVARLFAELSESPLTQAHYNLLFILSGGGHLNYAGSGHWLSEVEPALLATVEFALCIDSIGSASDELYFHSSKPATAPKMAPLFHAISAAGKAVGVSVRAVHKKINVSKERFNWEHEQFSMKRVLAATLSAHPAPAHLYGRSSIFDTREAIDLVALERNIRVVAEGIGRLLYAARWSETERRSEGEGEVEAEEPGEVGDVQHGAKHGWDDLTIFESVFADSSSGSARALSPHFLAAWADYLSSTPRVGPYLASAESEVLSQIYQVLRQHTAEATEQQFPLDTQYSFYSSTQTVLSAYRVKNVMFDIFSGMIILGYLALLHIVFNVLFSKEGVGVLTADGLAKLFGIGPAK